MTARDDAVAALAANDTAAAQVHALLFLGDQIAEANRFARAQLGVAVVGRWGDDRLPGCQADATALYGS